MFFKPWVRNKVVFFFFHFPFTCNNPLAIFVEYLFSSSVIFLGIIATEQNAGSVKHFELRGEQKLQGKYRILLASGSQLVPFSPQTLPALGEEDSNKAKAGSLH